MHCNTAFGIKHPHPLMFAVICFSPDQIVEADFEVKAVGANLWWNTVRTYGSRTNSPVDVFGGAISRGINLLMTRTGN